MPTPYPVDSNLLIRAVKPEDFEAWLPLWEGYNTFYGRSGTTALPTEITLKTWERFLNPVEPVFAMVAESDGVLTGLVHYLFHRSTTQLAPVCYLQDLFTTPSLRKQGIGQALIQAVYQQAMLAGSRRVYWQTHTTNATGRSLYDKLAEHKGFIIYSHSI